MPPPLPHSIRHRRRLCCRTASKKGIETDAPLELRRTLPNYPRTPLSCTDCSVEWDEFSVSPSCFSFATGSVFPSLSRLSARFDFLPCVALEVLPAACAD